MTELKYKFKSDILFKLLFTKHKDLLQSLVAAVLYLKTEDIRGLEITNEAIVPDLLKDKFCKLDLNMNVDGNKLDIEIQVADQGNYRERASYYASKLVSGSLDAGENYKKMPQSILVSIIDFDLFACEKFDSEFALLEKTRHELLCDKMELRFFELRKLPKIIDTNDMLQVWLKIFSAETEEDLKELKELEVKEVRQALEAYNYIIGSPEYQELERVRERALHDEAQALLHSWEAGVRESDVKWQNVLADKDAALAEKDAENARLREQLLAFQTQDDKG
jgi:predicted transposase/invertase (TIGR01784 family)